MRYEDTTCDRPVAGKRTYNLDDMSCSLAALLTSSSIQLFCHTCSPPPQAACEHCRKQADIGASRHVKNKNSPLSASSSSNIPAPTDASARLVYI